MDLSQHNFQFVPLSLSLNVYIFFSIVARSSCLDILKFSVNLKYLTDTVPQILYEMARV